MFVTLPVFQLEMSPLKLFLFLKASFMYVIFDVSHSLIIPIPRIAPNIGHDPSIGASAKHSFTAATKLMPVSVAKLWVNLVAPSNTVTMNGLGKSLYPFNNSFLLMKIFFKKKKKKNEKIIEKQRYITIKNKQKKRMGEKRDVTYC